MNRADGIECYQKALRQGQRDYREKMNAGQSPFLPVLTKDAVRFTAAFAKSMLFAAVARAK